MGSYLMICYGFIVLLGGLIGYLTAGSVPSLVMGSLFGASIVASGMAMLKQQVWGYVAAIILSFTLLLFFGYRFYLTGLLMPAGGMALLSLLVFIFFLTLKNQMYRE